MARALFTDGVSGLSGSINKKAGGATYQKNGIKRVRVVPVNPQTTFQQQVRAAFLFLTSQFSALSTTQVAAWEAARTGNVYYLKQDPLTGVSRPYASAKDLFIAMNMNALTSSGSLGSPSVVYNTPGAGEAPGTLSVTSFVFDNSANSVVLTYSGSPVGTLMVEATKALSVGTQRAATYSSKLRVFATSVGASPATLSSEYNAKLGAVGAVGRKVFWRIWEVAASTGKKTLLASGESIIQA